MKTKTQHTLWYIGFLTLYGGFLNGYSYCIRGGYTITMQSGNMAKIGIALEMGNMTLLVNSLTPVVGCTLGIAFIQVVHHKWYRDASDACWQRACLWISALLLIPVGFWPSSGLDPLADGYLAFVSAVELCNMQSYLGVMHNLTITSGNVRNLGILLGEAINLKDFHTFTIAIRYCCVMFLFSVGGYLGAFSGEIFMERAIWLPCIGLLFFALLIQPEKEDVESHTL